MRLSASSLISIGFPVLVFFAGGPARALDLKPELIFLRGEEGAAVSTTIAVVNNSSETIRVTLEAHGPGEAPAPWLSLSPRALRVAAGARRVVRLKAVVPKAVGEMWGEVWVRQRAPGELTETRVVRRVALRVAGTEVFEAQLKDIESGVEGNDVVVHAVLANTGNVTLRAKLVADLERMDGPLVRAVTDLTGQPVAPGESVRARLAAPKVGWFWTGRGNLSAYYRDADGKTIQILKPIGEASRGTP